MPRCVENRDTPFLRLYICTPYLNSLSLRPLLFICVHDIRQKPTFTVPVLGFLFKLFNRTLIYRAHQVENRTRKCGFSSINMTDKHNIQVLPFINTLDRRQLFLNFLFKPTHVNLFRNCNLFNLFGNIFNRLFHNWRCFFRYLFNSLFRCLFHCLFSNRSRRRRRRGRRRRRRRPGIARWKPRRLPFACRRTWLPFACSHVKRRRLR
mmetsp:Transcript_2917/g.4187  ORF Transcript_2917/g.4187 Transcript_2917/m.4187 type:complete len:207 (+) Transcript_2917:1945-2565(+)